MRRMRQALEPLAYGAAGYPWAVLVLPLVAWGGGVPILLYVLDYAMTDVLDEITLVMYVGGLLVIGVLGGFTMAVAGVIEDFTWGRRAPWSENPEHLDIPLGAVPEHRHDIAMKLANRYTLEFASWFIFRADESDSDKSLELGAAQAWPEWEAVRDHGTRNEYVDALHEAALVIVGVALGRTPEYSVIPAQDEYEDFADLDHSFTRFFLEVPALQEENAAWIHARTVAAGSIVERERFEAPRGDQQDLAQLRDACLAIVAGGRPPAGYRGDLTISALTAQAFQEAEEILQLHQRALRAIAHELAEEGFLGGRDLLRILHDHPEEDD